MVLEKKLFVSVWRLNFFWERKRSLFMKPYCLSGKHFFVFEIKQCVNDFFKMYYKQGRWRDSKPCFLVVVTLAFLFCIIQKINCSALQCSVWNVCLSWAVSGREKNPTAEFKCLNLSFPFFQQVLLTTLVTLESPITIIPVTVPVKTTILPRGAIAQRYVLSKGWKRDWSYSHQVIFENNPKIVR